MSDTLSSLLFQHSSILMKDMLTDSQKLDQKVHFIIIKSNYKIDINFSTLNDLLSQHSLIIKSVSENLKKLLQKIYHIIITIIIIIIKKKVSIISESAEQEKEIC